MKKVIIAVSVLLIVSIAAWGCAKPPEVPEVPKVPEVRMPEVINIGVIHPVTGGCAAAGTQMTAGAQLAVDQINERGGIKNLDGAQLKLVVGDCQSLPDVAATEADRLITREDCVILMGAYAFTMPAMVECQKHKTPFIGSVMGCHVPKDYDWIFRDFNAMEYDHEEIFGAIKYFTDTTGVGPKTLAQITNDGEWGLTTAGIAVEVAEREGIEVVYNDVFPFGTCTDFMPYLIKAQASEADMLMISSCPPNHTFFTKQLWEAEIDFPFGIISTGCAVESPMFYKTVTDEMVEYYFVQEDCDIWIKHRPFYSFINDPIQAEIGTPVSAYGLCGYGVVWDAKDALERTSYHTDIGVFRSNLRDALTMTDITQANCADLITLPDGTKFCPALVRGIDRVKFEQGHRAGDLYWQNVYSRGQISQNIGGERVPMFPTAVHPKGTPDFVWPVPKWSER